MKMIKTEFKDYVTDANGLSYIPWAVALQHARGIKQETIPYEGGMSMPLYGGFVVGVRSQWEGVTQDIWLPVLGPDNNPVLNPTARDISDQINRCRCKAVAMITGYGLGLYAGYKSAAAFAKDLGEIKEGDDLAKVKPICAKKGGKADYIPWAASIAAARLSDPTFWWEVVFMEGPDENGEIRKLPYTRPFAGGVGFLVGVTVHGRFGSHTEWLPIMGILPVNTRNGVRKLDFQPLPEPNVADWNRAVMRCLTKAIAVATGYGIEVYGDEVVSEAKDPDQVSTEEHGEQPSHTNIDLVIAIRDRLKEVGKNEADLIKWLKVKADSLEEIPQDSLMAAAKVLKIAA